MEHVTFHFTITHGRVGRKQDSVKLDSIVQFASHLSGLDLALIVERDAPVVMETVERALPTATHSIGDKATPGNICPGAMWYIIWRTLPVASAIPTHISRDETQSSIAICDQ
jgi:hypothetical protein